MSFLDDVFSPIGKTAGVVQDVTGLTPEQQAIFGTQVGSIVLDAATGNPVGVGAGIVGLYGSATGNEELENAASAVGAVSSIGGAIKSLATEGAKTAVKEGAKTAAEVATDATVEAAKATGKEAVKSGGKLAQFMAKAEPYMDKAGKLAEIGSQGMTLMQMLNPQDQMMGGAPRGAAAHGAMPSQLGVAQFMQQMQQPSAGQAYGFGGAGGVYGGY